MATEIEFVTYKEFVENLDEVTDFASTDKSVVSNGENGPRSIDSSFEKKMLQNVVIKEFVPNSTTAKRGQRFIHNNYPYEAKEDVPAGAWDGTKWTLITDFLEKSVVGMGGITSSTYGSDLNNYPANTILTCTSNTIGENIAHLPNTEYQFCVATFGSGFDVGTKFQILVTQSKKKFIRSQWGAINAGWSSWVELKDVGDTGNHTIPIFSTLSSYYGGQRVIYNNYPYEAKEDVPAGAWDGTKWTLITDRFAGSVIGRGNVSSGIFNNNLDSYPMNTIFTCASDSIGGSISNKPNGEKKFSIITLGSSVNSGTKIQIVNTASKKMFMRSQWGAVSAGWSSWAEIKDYTNQIPYDNVLAAFNNIVCIGDSLTYSQVWTGAATTRQAYKTWPQIVGKASDADVEVFAQSGDTTIANWTRYNSQVASKTNALAIIYLGTNAGLTDTLDTDAPAADDPSTWADTNTGCYAKWVNKLQDLGYKVLLIKCWAVGTGASLETTNSVIEQIGTRFGCAVLDKIENNESQYHYWPSREGTNQVHYNDLGYAWFASELIKRVSNLGEGLKYILPI